MTRFERFLRNTTFRRQLTIAVTVGVLGIALLSALASSWEGSRQIRDLLRDQGQRIAENLAAQSQLALLYDSADNAASAIDVTLAFPDVVQVEIRHASGRPLLVRSHGKSPATSAQESAAANKPLSFANPRPYLEAESSADWRFVAPVYSKVNDESSPFAVEQAEPQLLGFVRIVVSKSKLDEMLLRVFGANSLISFLLAFVFLFAIRYLTVRLTRPLQQLAVTMRRAEHGENEVRAGLDGPRDIVDMAHAFNSMIAVLEQREQELRLARDEAMKFARLKAEFAATLGHEIRTPLNGVVGTLDLLKATELPSKQRQFVRLAWDSSQYLLDLVNNILDFSRLEAGKLELDRLDFDLVHVVEDVIDLVAPQAHQKGLELGYLIDADVPKRLAGDRRRISQVLINLVGNAIKFTASGEVSIHVSLCETALDTEGGAQLLSKDRNKLCFSVLDTGIGISEEARGRIFDSFAQADTSTTRRYGGSGLGLAISRQLVALMGGEIDVESREGVGSCFWFSARLGEATTSDVPQKPDAIWRGKPVLVVDESEVVRQFLVQTFSAWGMNVKAVETADAALTALHDAVTAGKPFALVVMDSSYAQHGSGELPERILADMFIANVQIVFMNRFAAQAVPASALADSWLIKPLRVERVLTCLEDLAARTVKAQTHFATPAPAPAARECRVLVAEDNGVNQAVAQGMLSMLGCQVKIVDNGVAAVQAFRDERWDLILMDCNMPDMDGYEATAAIRSLEAEGLCRTEHGRMAIIAMTANIRQADVEKCLAAGMDDHLAKPMSMDSLSAILTRWHGGSFEIKHTAEQIQQASTPFRLPPSAPIDGAVLETLREALGGAIGQAIKPFLEDMPTYLEELDQAFAAGDLERLRRAAHAIKGASGNLGAVPLTATARDIEAHAEDGNLETMQALLGRAHAEYAMVKPPLLAALKADLSRPIENVAEGALVLVVDDDRSTRAALHYALQLGGFQVQEAADGAQALAAVERMTPDVILMDAMMPVMDGFTACARLKESPYGKDIPVLMITALEDSNSIERAFAAGAIDYVPKPIHLAVVNQRMRRVIEANRAERHVRHLAYNDVVTGLPNRVQFTDQLTVAIARATEQDQSLAVLFLDLDRFKFVNDTLGHHSGDRLLKMVGQRIRHSVRASDTVARLGGDEFTILLSELPNLGAAGSAAKKVERALSTPFEIDGHDLFITTSIGISIFPDDGGDMNTLLRHADTAMYRAKRENTGFQFYESGMEERISEHLKLESALRRALERDELVVYYQPEAEAGTGRLIGMEALVRWRHGTRGLVSPADFIPLAEETGMIVPIGEWVLRTACRQAQTWIESGVPELRMAVNLSVAQLVQPGFIETVQGILQETGLAPERLGLEVTESVLMEGAHHAEKTLRQLRDLGVYLAIDDFGTGYSSFSYLKRFPVDLLKIDYSFTRDITTDPDAAAIVTGIVALAHSLRLKVIAEGVETEEQHRVVTELGCDFIQGYLLSKPVPADMFEAKILSQHFPASTYASRALQDVTRD